MSTNSYVPKLYYQETDKDVFTDELLQLTNKVHFLNKLVRMLGGVYLRSDAPYTDNMCVNCHALTTVVKEYFPFLLPGVDFAMVTGRWAYNGDFIRNKNKEITGIEPYFVEHSWIEFMYQGDIEKEEDAVHFVLDVRPVASGYPVLHDHRFAGLHFLSEGYDGDPYMNARSKFTARQALKYLEELDCDGERVNRKKLIKLLNRSYYRQNRDKLYLWFLAQQAFNSIKEGFEHRFELLKSFLFPFR